MVSLTRTGHGEQDDITGEVRVERSMLLHLSGEDYATVIDALNYAAEDFAERANIESKYRSEDAEPGEEEESYSVAADRYSATLSRVGPDRNRDLLGPPLLEPERLRDDR